MKRLSPNQRTKQPARGFTLVEILVVIGIVVFLITMTVTVVSSSLATAREKNTKALIKKIDGLLAQRLVAFDKGLKTQNLNNSHSAQAVSTKKKLFRQYFPQRLSEINSNLLMSLSYDSTKDDPATQSAEALYIMITKMESFSEPPAGEDAFSSSEAQDTDGDGLKEFVDAWGQPLRFYRWPTRLIRPAPAGQESTPQTLVVEGSGTSKTVRYEFPLNPVYDFGPEGLDAGLLFGSVEAAPAGSMGRKPRKAQPLLIHENADPLAKDPDDPSGITVNRNNATAIQNYENNFHTPDTWSTPLIISAGSDGVLGLHEPTDDTNRGRLAQPNHAELSGLFDNITNRNLQP